MKLGLMLGQSGLDSSGNPFFHSLPIQKVIQYEKKDWNG
jgi:hypothetical protein